MPTVIDGRTYQKALFLFAPIWVSDPEGECYTVARWGWLGEIIMDLAECVINISNFVLSSLDPYYEPTYPILILEDHRDELF